MDKQHLSRRNLLKGAALGAGAAFLGFPNIAGADEKLFSMKGKINHSVCRWCYGSIPLEEFCERSKDIGIQSIELTVSDEWPVLQKYGLTCAVATHANASLTNGFNDPQYHEQLIPIYIDLIRKAADNGIPNVIVFSGNRGDKNSEVGLVNCAKGLDKVVKEAEKRDVMVVMELLNSKINHPDYQCDNTPWGAALVDIIGSPKFKLLYDIYHMQIMEGDVIHTIRDYKDYIAHYHTGGVPGRNEINESQELNYPAIMRAIVETGFDGYVAQEFIPTYDDKLAALAEGVKICDV